MLFCQVRAVQQEVFVIKKNIADREKVQLSGKIECEANGMFFMLNKQLLVLAEGHTERKVVIKKIKITGLDFELSKEWCGINLSAEGALDYFNENYYNEPGLDDIFFYVTRLKDVAGYPKAILKLKSYKTGTSDRTDL
jgi:hypothetical protein